jgi:Cytochrome P460
MSSRRAIIVAWVIGCGGNGGVVDGPPPLFPADYGDTYVELRGCRHSLEHSLVQIRVMVEPQAVAPYDNHVDPFPEGSIIVKEEYNDSDEACADPIENFTLMQKLAVGSSPDTLDWRWQKVTAARQVTDSDGRGCINCHSDCGFPPTGYDATCTMP